MSDIGSHTLEPSKTLGTPSSTDSTLKESSDLIEKIRRLEEENRSLWTKQPGSASETSIDILQSQLNSLASTIWQFTQGHTSSTVPPQSPPLPAVLQPISPLQQ